MGVKNMIKRSLIITLVIFILCPASFAGQPLHSGGVILKNKISPPYSETQIPPKIRGTSTLFSDDFEGAFPGIKWQAGCVNLLLYYDAYWGQTSFKAYQGTKSVWCAAAGTAGVDPSSNNYLDYMYAYMVAGPFNLTDATAGTYSLHYWMKTEKDADTFVFGVSTDGYYYWGGMDSGDSQGWVSGSVDLSNVPVLGNVLGQSSVYIGCFFASDYNINDAGVFVDDVLLTVTTGGPTPTPTATPVANLKLIIGSNQGSPGQTIPIQIKVDNAANCKAFGFDLQFDTSKLAYVSTAKGTATGDWADVNGNSITGGARVGGFAGSGNAITGSAQEICKVNLQVKQAACPGAGVSITAVNLKDCLNGATVQNGAITPICTEPTPTPTPTPVANLKLIIGSNQGSPGQTIPIQIKVDNAANCTAFGFDLQFDTSKLAYISTAKGTATGDWADVNGNSITGGARVGGFAGSGNAITGSAQEICKVNLQVKQAACPGANVSITAVNLKDCLNGATVQNGAVTPICTEPTPTPTPIPGELTIYILKKYILGVIPLTQQQMTQADKNQDQKVDVADLIKMVIEAPQPTPTPTPTPVANPLLKIGTGSGAPLQTVEITIKTDNVNNCSAFGFDMQFDTTKLSFVKVDKGTATNDWAAVAGNAITGGVRVGGFAGSGTPFSGTDKEICKVTLKVENAACPAGGAIELNAINLKDSLKGAVVIKGSITAICGSSTSSAGSGK
jgi:hypothetical protein